jgi:hypothetical protein
LESNMDCFTSQTGSSYSLLSRTKVSLIIVDKEIKTKEYIMLIFETTSSKTSILKKSNGSRLN